MYIIIAEPIAEVGIDWLREQGAQPLLTFQGEEWQSKAEQIKAFIYRGSIPIDAELLDQLPALEVVGKHGVGVNTVDLAETSARGIKVTNVRGANANSVAEHAVTLLTAATRSLIPCDTAVREGRFGDRLGMRLVREIRGTRLGVVGGGNIGRRVAEICRGGFGCVIGIHDPYIGAGALEQLQARSFPSVAALLEWADNIVVAAPLTPETKGVIGREELELLGPDGVIVISSRGGIVDESALTAALRAGAIRGAGIDVYEPEPPEPDNPLFELENVVLTPHFGGHTDAAREAMSRGVCEQVWALLNGGDAPLVGGEAWIAR